MDEKDKLLQNLLQELKRGTLVLSVLICAKKQIYGYSLVTKLQSAGIEIEQNTLYPLLRRLEKQGLLISSWDTSDSRPRKYYIISELGIEITNILKQEWKRMNNVIENMIIKEGQ